MSCFSPNQKTLVHYNSKIFWANSTQSVFVLSSPMLYYFVFTNFWVGESYSAWILQAPLLKIYSLIQINASKEIERNRPLSMNDISLVLGQIILLLNLTSHHQHNNTDNPHHSGLLWIKKGAFKNSPTQTIRKHKSNRAMDYSVQNTFWRIHIEKICKLYWIA